MKDSKTLPKGFVDISQDIEFAKFDSDNTSIQGTFTGFRETTYGKSAVIKNGTIVYGLPVLTVLNDLLKNINPNTEVFIKYLGDKSSKAGNTFKDFSVAVKESELPF